MRGGSVVATNITKEYGATVVLDRALAHRSARRAHRRRRAERQRQVDAAARPRRRRRAFGRARRAHRHRRLPAAGAGAPAGRDAARLPRAAHGRRGRRRRGWTRGDARRGRRSSSRSAARDLEPRARKVVRASSASTCRSTQELPTLSGGEAARVSLAALLLSRFDVALPRRADERPRLRRARAARAVRASASPARSSSCPTTARSSTER